MAIDQRPNGIECPEWEPASPGAKRCRWYEHESGPHECGHALIGGVECVEFVRLRQQRRTNESEGAPRGALLAAGALVTSQEPTSAFSDVQLALGGPRTSEGTASRPENSSAEKGPFWPGNGASQHSGRAAPPASAAAARPQAEPGGGPLGSPLGLGLGSQLGSQLGSGSPLGLGSQLGSQLGSGSRIHPRIRDAIELGLLPPPEFEPAKSIDPKSIEALEASVDEIVMHSSSLKREIVLVREVDPSDTRLTISFRDAATIRLLVDAFPGAQVVDIRRASEHPKE